MTKRIIALILASIMLLSFTACSNEEIGMYSLIKEISSLKSQEMTGTINLSAQGIYFDSLLAGAPEQVRNSIKDGVELKYNLKQIKSPAQFEAAIDIRFKNETNFHKLTTIISEKDTMYIKLDDLLKFIRPYVQVFQPTEVKTIDELISKVEFVKIDLTNPNSIDSLGTISNNEESVKLALSLMDIIQKSFKDFSAGIVTKKNNGYEMNLDVKELQNLIFKFVEYVTTNIDSIVDNAATSIKSMSDEEISMLSLFTGKYADKEDVINSLEGFRTMVKQTKASDIAMIKSELSNNQVFNAIEGSKLTYNISKDSSGIYDLSTELIVNYMGLLKINVSEKWNIKIVPEFSVSKPSNAVNQEKLQEILKPFTQVKQLSIDYKTRKTWVVYGSGRNSDLYIPFVSQDGSTYIPLYMINSTFDETIKWDYPTKAASIYRDGEKIDMDSRLIRNQAYIKVKDLEKLGYSIQWDEATKIATIIKP
ncbi:MAG: hypothetical protein K0R31_974 [Clostridiales bacterium]|jgi:hypothetical protein|nr:hypothetical protein [Clostridiales bacterium]